MATLEDRKAMVIERITKREEERESSREQRRAGWGIDSDKRGTLHTFFERLRVEGDVILAKLDESKLESMTLLEQKNVFSDAMDGIEKLNRHLNESTMYLPAYDIEQSRDLIQGLQGHLTAVRDRLQPKKKFAFGGRRKKAVEKAVVEPQKVEKERPVESLGDYGACERSDEEIRLSETVGKDLFLSQLTNCRVAMAGGGKAMRIDRLEGCVVVCAPMSGSIFIENCKDCIFVLACQQLRIHSTTNTKFYIHVTSKAIIEFCSQLQFAPYCVTSDTVELEERFGVANLSMKVNNWEKVDDFCHLAVDVKSANWTVLPEEERQTWSLL